MPINVYPCWGDIGIYRGFEAFFVPHSGDFVQHIWPKGLSGLLYIMQGTFVNFRRDAGDFVLLVLSRNLNPRVDILSEKVKKKESLCIPVLTGGRH